MAGLDGIRVLEIAGGFPAAWAAKLFADLGADVIRYEAPGFDGVRDRPHEVHRWLNTSKRSVRSGLDRLMPEADILIQDRNPAETMAIGLHIEALRRSHPSLVICSITPFGMTGPLADLHATELTLMHSSSWGWLTPGASDRPDLPPVRVHGHQASIHAASVGAIAAMAAFDKADRTGVGEHVDLSMQSLNAKMTETAPSSFTNLGIDPSRLGTRALNPWGVYQCQDGLVQFICVEEEQWSSLVGLMGDPEWASMEVVSTMAARNENPDLVDIYLSEWIGERTVGDLYHEGQAHRLCISPIMQMSDLEDNAQLRSRGFFASDGELTLPGPLVQFDRPWWSMRSPAPNAGAHDGETWRLNPPLDSAGTTAPGIAKTDQTSAGSKPLAGIRVCDLSWIWAGPWCTMLLAHLGADVIKIESEHYLDLTRRLPFNPPDTELTPDTAGVFHQWNLDKRSIQVDLGTADGIDIAKRLIAASDVVIDNFEVGTLDRLGLDADALRAINPDILITKISGYGQEGPYSAYMAYGPAGGALSGLSALTGYEGGPPLELGIALGDPASGIAAAWGIVASLVARRRTGEVASMDVAMVEAVTATIGEGWMDFLATGENPERTGNHDDRWAPHNCYRTVGDDEWIAIACTDEAQWQALTAALDPKLANDPRFVDQASRKASEAALDDAISALVGGRERWELTDELQGVGVPAFPSASPGELWADNDHMAARGMLETPDHPIVGARTVPGIPWLLTQGANGVTRPAPTLGQHTREVLADLLGFTEARIDALDAAGVLR